MEQRADEELEEIEQRLMNVAERTRRSIEELVAERPHVALAAAVAAGFVLGGGLTPRRLVRFGLAFAGPSLTQVLVGEATRALRAMVEGAPIDEGPGRGAVTEH